MSGGVYEYSDYEHGNQATDEIRGGRGQGSRYRVVDVPRVHVSVAVAPARAACAQGMPAVQAAELAVTR